ncbi:MAG: hypothetical protein AAF436_04990 [Myxococcota bacterium]
MSSVHTEPPPPPPNPDIRRRSGLFIAGFVALQFIIPLTYLVREDRADDRFTWRVTAASEAPTCETTAEILTSEDVEVAVSPESTVHRDWIELLRRDRRVVVEAFLEKQCEVEGVLEATLVNTCDDAQGVRHYQLRCGGERAHLRLSNATGEVSARTAER